MQKRYVGSLIFLLLASAWPVHAVETTNEPEGTWEVTGTGASGAVGDTVALTFAIKNVRDRCVNAEARINTTGDARLQVSFINKSTPASKEFSSERITWRPVEFENGVAQNYRVYARVDRGAVGETISGFEIHANCHTEPEETLFNGIIDDIKITVTDKSAPAAKTATTLASISDLNSLFREIHGRNPTSEEWHYWADRLLDKSDRGALKGAMAYHKAHGRTIGDTPASTTSAAAKTPASSSGSLASISDLNSIFRAVHDRNPSDSEWHYWADRLLDKPNRTAFQDAITYHKQQGITH